MKFLVKVLLIFLIITPWVQRELKMQETNFYRLPSGSKINRVEYKDDQGFIALDKDKKILFTIYTYDNGPDYESENLIRIIDNEKIGFANLLGDVVIPPRFDFAYPFNSGFAAVCKDCKIIHEDEHSRVEKGKWGFIDNQGNLIIPYKYDEVKQQFKNGITVVKLNDKILHIKTNGESVTVENKNFNEWLRIFEKVVTQVRGDLLNDNYIIKTEFLSNHNYDFFEKDTQYLSLKLINNETEEVIVGYDIIPWTNFSIGKTISSQIGLTTLLTGVNDFAIIFKKDETNFTSEEDNELINRFSEQMEFLLEIEETSKLEEANLNIPESIQVISSKIYKYYVDLQVALPGSKLLVNDEWTKIIKGKMVCLHLVPDFGEVKSTWIKTEPNPMDVYYTAVEDSLLNIFSDGIERINNYPEKRYAIYNSLKEQIRSLFNSANSYVNVLYDTYEKRLYSWLFVDHKKDDDQNPEKLFSDYQQKKTPDTIFDYAPSIIDSIKDFPEANIENLQKLLALFEQYKLAADLNQGQWEEGNMILGAKPKEFRPSEEELMLAEIGNRIKSILIKADTVDTEKTYTISYQDFLITHVDVMGSGRFFYVDEIKTIQLSVPIKK